jgi:hypothetical protein
VLSSRATASAGFTSKKEFRHQPLFRVAHLAQDNSQGGRKMIVKSTLLAVLVSLVIFGSLDVAQAQSFTNGAFDPAHLAVLGWNYGHLSNCSVSYDGSTTWFSAVPQENPTGYLFTNNPGFAAILAAACQSGNLGAAHVTSLNPIRWDQIYTFTFK